MKGERMFGFMRVTNREFARNLQLLEEDPHLVDDDTVVGGRRYSEMKARVKVDKSLAQLSRLTLLVKHFRDGFEVFFERVQARELRDGWLEEPARLENRGNLAYLDI